MKLSDVANKISLLVQAAGCAVLYFIMEAICRRSIGAAYTYMTTRPLVFAYNTAFIFTTMLIVYLSRRRVFWRTLIVTFWLLLALSIAVFSKTPVKAAVNTFLFFAGMCAAYHIYTVVFSGFNPMQYMMIWYGFTIISPLLAAVC